ncbi:MAG: NAD(+)/NADH kinase [Ruminococcaceae bacterium]|nr:NAD(+)/NADH kinase [Oscillospiraceae bacterium]
MKRFLIKPNPKMEHVREGIWNVANSLRELGATVLMEHQYRCLGEIEEIKYCTSEEVDQVAEAVLVLGGDGTLLRAAHETRLPLLGINFGHLGFISELTKEETDLFSRLIEDDFQIESRMMLRCVRIRNGEENKPFYALNDIVTSRGTGESILRMNLLIDDAYADTYLADGLIVTTPTGSTAYALSAGGSILEPDVEALEITPVCPHMLRARSLVVSSQRKIAIMLAEEKSAHVVADGIALYDIQAGDRLEIKRGEKETRFIRVHSRSFYDILHEKLGSDTH